jgi:Mg-chelatase subunit ChlD
MLGTPAKLRRDVSQALRSPETTATLRNETRGRFDMRNAHRASIGAVNVFKRRQEEEGQETAVSFLVDMSSSMMGQNIRSAVSLALHLGDAAKACSCPFEVLGFLSPKSNPNGPTAGLLEVKAFRDPWQEARGWVGSMVSAASGGTSMMPAIPDAAARLRNQHGVSRRILIVLTDGEDGWPRQSVRAAVKGAVAQGVEVVMLGIGTSVTHLGVPHVNVTSLEDVAKDGLKALVAVLK